MDQVRADLAGRPGHRSVVLAHAFVVGATGSGSERSIAVGGVESVGADVFDGVDYVALGHLHTPQQLAPQLRYSGSILPYSFTETTGGKGVWLIDLTDSGRARGGLAGATGDPSGGLRQRRARPRSSWARAISPTTTSPSS